CIERAPPAFVKFGPRFIDDPGEGFVLPECVVPGRFPDIDCREHPILSRSAAPEHGAERLFHPYVRPVAVVWLSLDVNGDSGAGGGFTKQGRGVHGACKSRVGSAQFDRKAVVAGLLQKASGAVRIIDPLFELGGLVAICRTYRMVIGDAT